jgi:hypothetical protein
MNVYFAHSFHLDNQGRQLLEQSRSQSMPVRGLCSGMTLGNRIDFIQNEINGAYAFIALVYSAY